MQVFNHTRKPSKEFGATLIKTFGFQLQLFCWIAFKGALATKDSHNNTPCCNHAKADGGVSEHG